MAVYAQEFAGGREIRVERRVVVAPHFSDEYSAVPRALQRFTNADEIDLFLAEWHVTHHYVELFRRL
jgi:hypothetical protein